MSSSNAKEDSEQPTREFRVWMFSQLKLLSAWKLSSSSLFHIVDGCSAHEMRCLLDI